MEWGFASSKGHPNKICSGRSERIVNVELGKGVAVEDWTNHIVGIYAVVLGYPLAEAALISYFRGGHC